jgi:hypothetical protein
VSQVRRYAMGAVDARKLFVARCQTDVPSFQRNAGATIALANSPSRSRHGC